MVTKPRSPLWYELPLLFSIVGGIIAYFILKKDDPVKAKRCIILGVVFMIPLVLVLFSLVFLGSGPFFVIVSGSMVPALEVYDVVIADANYSFEDIVIGDIIVFNRPQEDGRIIVARVNEVIGDEPLTFETKGDANQGPIPGTDFPITKSEYIGKIDQVIPQVGYVTQLLKPPTNTIINVIQFALLIIPIILHVQFTKRDKQVSD